MSELTLFLIRIAYLAILWIFVLSAISVIRSDMFGARVPEGARTVPNNPKQKPPPKRRGSPSQVVVTSGSNSGATASLAEAPILIGRGTDAAIRLDDDYVSTRHARIRQTTPLAAPMRLAAAIVAALAALCAVIAKSCFGVEFARSTGADLLIIAIYVAAAVIAVIHAARTDRDRAAWRTLASASSPSAPGPRSTRSAARTAPRRWRGTRSGCRSTHSPTPASGRASPRAGPAATEDDLGERPDRRADAWVDRLDRDVPGAGREIGVGHAQAAAYLVYPIGDVVLLALAIVAIAFTGWRPGRPCCC